MMTPEQIKTVLYSKYTTEKGYACIEELRNCTGYAYNITYVDFYIIGLWQSTPTIAFEIKTNRQDFFRDVEKFKVKQAFALSSSNQFYYIAPKDIIKPDEVPELSGLFTISNNNAIRKVKQAPHREMEVDENLFQSMVRQLSKNNSSRIIPTRYLGKEITDQDFQKIVNKKWDDYREYQFENEVNDRVEKALKNEDSYQTMIVEILKKIGLINYWNLETNDQSALLEEIRKRVQMVEQLKDVNGNFEQIKSIANRLIFQIENYEKTQE